MEWESELWRRLQHIVQLGTISEAHPTKALARVSLLGRVTGLLPVVSLGNSFKRHWIPPRVHEQVAVLSPQGEGDDGLILRGIFSRGCPEPAQANGHLEVVEYEDGTTLSYDSQKKLLSLDCAKDVRLKVKGDVVLEVGGSLRIQKKDHELLTLMNQFMEELITARTATLMGPQPLFGEKFPEIKAKIEAFRGSA